MKILYFDCNMGAAGDMIAASLIELFPDSQTIVQELNCLNIPNVRFSVESVRKCGICGSQLHVSIHGEEEHADDQHELHPTHAHAHSHHGNSMDQISHIISHLIVPDCVKKHIVSVYRLIADAESKVHGMPVNQIHFHEVGDMDAIADITATCYLLHRLGVDCVYASPVHVGAGQVKCAHGILPVPAPATAHILMGVPIYGGEIQGELCTPTGAALLKHFTMRFGQMPQMSTISIGYGMGKKDFSSANCIRAMLGETSEQSESIVELSCNIDDMTGEELGFAMEQLLKTSALDVYTIPIGMKKNRPGILLGVLCRQVDVKEIVESIFQNTTTLGIRESVKKRYTLSRSFSTCQTPYGDTRIKHATGYGTYNEKIEYEDLASIARKQKMRLRDAGTYVTQCFNKAGTA